MIRDWDISVFRSVNGWSDSTAPVWEFFSYATKRTDGLVVILLAVIAMLIFPKSRKAVFLGLVAVLLANETTDFLKDIWPIARPCSELKDVTLRGGILTSMGTASAHSANMAAIATVTALTIRWWSAPWIVVAILTGISRLYVGVHYPSQVLAGWMVGALWGFAVVGAWNFAVEVWRERHPVAEPEPFATE